MVSRKTKILIPVLTIAGLGATIAPMMTMTSCGHDPKSDVSEYIMADDEPVNSNIKQMIHIIMENDKN